MRSRSLRRLGLPTLATALAVVAIAVGALLWFRPYLTRSQTFPSAVPAPIALTATSPFVVAAGQRACMSSVTVEPSSAAAQFRVEPAKPGSHRGPPLELLLTGTGYRSASHLPGGYRGGTVTLAVTPPAHSLPATVCFLDDGPETAVLTGSVEARTVSRLATTIAGTPVVGDISLMFLEGHTSSLLDRLGTAFTHASNLTDHLIPVWLIWTLAVLVALGVPCGISMAFYRALREDEIAGRI
ncbi:MAG: hypothetical protein ACRDK4_15325 [Solirubrobacteraceae bacterium]